MRSRLKAKIDYPLSDSSLAESAMDALELLESAMILYALPVPPALRCRNLLVSAFLHGAIRNKGVRGRSRKCSHCHSRRERAHGQTEEVANRRRVQ